MQSMTALHLSSTMLSKILLLLFAAVVNCNLEVDVLYAWKTQLEDPNNVLASWDSNLTNSCTWFHVTCNTNNSVTRLDLGDAGLSGPLIPQLGLLENLQYLVVYGNRINGTIPTELGNLTNLVSLDLYNNRLTGSIPTSLGNLKLLRFLRLNSNNLTGTLPFKIVYNFVNAPGNLMILNVSDNMMSGGVHALNSNELAVTTIIQDPESPLK